MDFRDIAVNSELWRDSVIPLALHGRYLPVVGCLAVEEGVFAVARRVLALRMDLL